MSQDIINTLTNFSVSDRFLRYVQIDTQSDPASSTFPSTAKQLDLSRLLVQELHEIGVSDAYLDEWGYVFATIPANTDKQVPVVCFCSHVDTSPDASGTNVKPLIHRNYQGDNIVLPDDPSVVIRPEEHPELVNQHGNDIITASGTTLLGADDKAGVAAIMDAARLLMKNPQIKHGTIKILFTPDEEIGAGVDKLDLGKLGADFAYTVDGETVGTIEDETFSADAMTLTIEGVGIHPGFAKGRMENALKIAGDILHALPKDGLSPETTTDREGFVHPVQLSGGTERAVLSFIIRDFTDEGLTQHAEVLKKIVDQVMSRYPGSKCQVEIKDQYRNMKRILDQHPEIMEIGMEAIRRTGLSPIRRRIRGGTDGSRLSFLGLPCPNIFAGGHAFHGKQEWVSIQDMQKTVKTILHIATLWEERANPL